jgi:Family of unknown function (DUF6494)
MDEDSFNIAVRKFLKVVGVTSQREIERVVREGKIEGAELKLRMVLMAENTPLNHVVEETIDLRRPVSLAACIYQSLASSSLRQPALIRQPAEGYALVCS